MKFSLVKILMSYYFYYQSAIYSSVGNSCSNEILGYDQESYRL